jgi:hypothetical protein
MSIPSGFHPTLCHDHAEIKPCPKCTIEDAEFARIFTTDQTPKVERLMDLRRTVKFKPVYGKRDVHFLLDTIDQLEQDKKDLIEALKSSSCGCYTQVNRPIMCLRCITLTKMGVGV